MSSFERVQYFYKALSIWFLSHGPQRLEWGLGVYYNPVELCRFIYSDPYVRLAFGF